ncbi:hypothetical protein [Pedobacter hiemivivus]|uniref:Thioredoxin domain-containing protein n=1 Tax=Pedobacter hiemivivus TaxID=2530454 RepID=A0A4R0NC41_9SPHI|nr:hypothetical protein [Pedobacter hiemivivus]TCC96562.1 hypothetical protein EZ444_11340 [Pedobacter hiemivivus]
MKLERRLYRVLYLFFTICSLSNCNTGNKQSSDTAISNKKSEKFTQPDSLITYKPFALTSLDSNKIFNSTLKIYSFIDASCSSCLASINNWKLVASEIKNYKVPIILIVQSEDNFELLKYLCEKKNIDNFPYPFYFDFKGQFFVRNKFLSRNKNGHTVLTDKNNNIIASGDMTLSKKVKEQYMNIIKANKAH